MPNKLAPKADRLSNAENVIEFPQSRFTPAEKDKKSATMGCVNPNELTSIRALTGYVAHNKNVPEDVVSAYLQAEFHIDDVAKLRRDDYENAIRFLVDLRAELLIN